jgi:hypothetical protein
VEALLAPKSEVVAPKAGVLLPTENGLEKAIGERLAPQARARASLRGSDLFKFGRFDLTQSIVTLGRR